MPICSSNIQVAIRVRPLSNKELTSNSRIIVELVESTQLNLHNPKLEGNQSIHDHRDRCKQFTFDHCYFSINRLDANYASQQIIFNDIGMDVLKSFIEGYNTCILCYGQTGTGKTFTMMGNSTNEEMGLTPKICENLFRTIETLNVESSTICFKTHISYMEIYNERLRDLFDFEAQKLNTNLANSKNSSLKIREHPTKGIYVQNLNQYTVTDLKNTMRYLFKGNQNRSTASTHVHDKSSRSHAIFTITFVQARVENEIPVEIMSKLHLVDLAGSERASNDLVYNKKQLKEGSNINKSLVSLGNVISVLAESAKRASMTNSNLSLSNSTSYADFSQETNSNTNSETKSSSSTFVPYRDSLLTYLLKDSLGGNSKTHMIANISPASCCYHETLNTLLFAQRAKKIINKPKINEDPKTALIKELKQEIFKLKELLSKASNLYSIQSLNMDKVDFNISGSQLELMLEKNEARAQELTLTWIDKWNTLDPNSSQLNPSISSPSLRSKRFSSGFMVQPDLPYIVALNDDPMSSDIMIYYIKTGETILGNDETLAEIVLKDENLSESHCLFQNFNGIVTISPFDDSLCIVNHVEIKQSTKLSQGDLIVLGKNVFRFNHPEEAAKLREKNQNSNCKALKSQSLPSLGRQFNNLSNDGLLMAKFIQLTNNTLKMEEFDIISRSSSYISSKSDFSNNDQQPQQARTKNDIKYLNNLKIDLNDTNKFQEMNENEDAQLPNTFSARLGQLNKKFHSEQIICKKEYDHQLNEFYENIRLNNQKNLDLDFDYDKYFYLTNSSNNQDEINFLDYIDKYKINSKFGQLKQKFNFELKFFMNLKNLRLTYMTELNDLNNLLQSTPQSNTPISAVKAPQTPKKSLLPVMISSNLSKKFDLTKTSSSRANFSSSLPVINSEAEEKHLGHELSVKSSASSSSISISTCDTNTNTNTNQEKQIENNQVRQQQQKNNYSPNSTDNKKLKLFNYDDEFSKDLQLLQVRIGSCSTSKLPNCNCCTSCAACVLCLSPVSEHEHTNLIIDSNKNCTNNKCKNCHQSVDSIKRSKSENEILTLSFNCFPKSHNENKNKTRSTTTTTTTTTSTTKNNTTTINTSTSSRNTKFKIKKRFAKLSSSSLLSLNLNKSNQASVKTFKSAKELSLKRKHKQIKRLDNTNSNYSICNSNNNNDNKKTDKRISLSFKLGKELSFLSQSDFEFESRSSSSRAHSVESSSTANLEKKSSCKTTKHLKNICTKNSSNNISSKFKNCSELDIHNHHKHLFPFYFSYNLKDSDDDCLNRRTNNLFKSSMNRIDNTHATFLNCLRDWNDPFLHGHKPVKSFGCQRCESCACRSFLSSNGAHSACSNPSLTCANQHHHNQHDIDLNRHYLTDTHSKLNRNLNQVHPFQPIIRCKSSANVPKTIDQCIKMAKSRPRPSSIKPHASRKSSAESSSTKRQPKQARLNNSKISCHSIDSDKESIDTISKEDEFKILFQSLSSPDSTLSHTTIFSKGNVIDSIESSACRNTVKSERIHEKENMSENQIENVLYTDLKPTNQPIDNKNRNTKIKKFTNRQIKNKNNLEPDENDDNNDNNDENDKKSFVFDKTITTIITTNENDEKMPNDDLKTNSNSNCLENTVSMLSSSTSSLIENDDIVYDDSLQDESFDSDSLMVDSVTTTTTTHTNANTNNTNINNQSNSNFNISSQENQQELKDQEEQENENVNKNSDIENSIQFVLNNTSSIKNTNTNNNSNLNSLIIMSSSTPTSFTNEESINSESLESSELQNGSKRNSKIIPTTSVAEENSKKVINSSASKKRRKSSSDSVEESTLNKKEKTSVHTNKLSYSESNLNTENDTDIDQDDEIENTKNLLDSNKIENEFDLIFKSKQAFLNKKNLLNLYKIVLEQTDLDLWDNTSNSPDSIENNCKLTVSIQKPFSLDAPNSNPKTFDLSLNNLSLSRSEYWSNKDDHDKLAMEQKEKEEEETFKNNSAINENTARLSPSSSLDRFRTFERQPSSPSTELENQIEFYNKVKTSFYLELDKSMINTENNKLNLTPPTSQSSSPSRRRSTSNEQKFFGQLSLTSNPSENDLVNKSESTRILYNFPGDIVGGEKYRPNLSSRSSSRSSSLSKKSLSEEDTNELRKTLSSLLCQIEEKCQNESITVPRIIVHETKPQSEFNSNQSLSSSNVNEHDLTKVTSLFDSFPSETSLVNKTTTTLSENEDEQNTTSSCQLIKSIIFEDDSNNMCGNHDNQINNNENKEELIILPQNEIYSIKSIIKVNLNQQQEQEQHQNKQEPEKINEIRMELSETQLNNDQEISVNTISLSSSKNFNQEPNLRKRHKLSELNSQNSTKVSSLESSTESTSASKNRISSFLTNLSPLKKRAKIQTDELGQQHTGTWLLSSKIHSADLIECTQEKARMNLSIPSSSTLRAQMSEELKSYSDKNDNIDEDEFFLAISSSGLETGSCPEFYWYPVMPFGAAMTDSGTHFDMLASFIINKKKRSKSENDLCSSTTKSFENITHSNYVQMINSMITGAMSEAADPEYVEYLKRHIQGLFDNFAPVLLKSKSNEEITINSPSRDKIAEIISQSIPKSFSLDFKLLEESKLNQSEDVMDFSKFGLGIKDKTNDSDEQVNVELFSSVEEDLNKSQKQESQPEEVEEQTNSQVQEVLDEILDKLSQEEKNLCFKYSELKSSTKINFDSIEEAQANKPNNSSILLLQTSSLQHSYLNSINSNDDSNEIPSTPIGSESTASTIVTVKAQCTYNEEDEENNSFLIKQNSFDESNSSSSSSLSDTISTPATSAQETVLIETPTPNLNAETFNNESVVIDEFEYHYKENMDIEDENESIENRHRTSSSSSSTESPSSQSIEVFGSIKINQTVSDCTETTKEQEFDNSESSPKLAGVSLEPTPDLAIAQMSKSELIEANTSKESSTSSSSSSTTSNDWLDVQNAINEYRNLSSDEENDDDERSVENFHISPLETGFDSIKPIEITENFDQIVAEPSPKQSEEYHSSDSEGELEQNNILDLSERQQLIPDSEKSFENRHSFTIESVDDVQIECKIDYKIRSSDDIDSSMSESVSSFDSEKRASDYDNLYVLNNTDKKLNSSTQAVISLTSIPNESTSSFAELGEPNELNTALSTSMNSVNSAESGSNQNLVNETFASFTSINSSEQLIFNKSIEDEDEENVEYNFVEDFTDLSKEFEENWIQEDEFGFSNLVNMTKNFNPMGNSIHPPRILHRIEEEGSLSSESEAKLSSAESNLDVSKVHEEEEQVKDVTKPEEEISEISSKALTKTHEEERITDNEIFIKTSGEYKNLLMESDKFLVTFEYSFKKDENLDESLSKSSKEKLRTQQCNIDSLLGSLSPSIGTDQNEVKFNLLEQNLVSTKIDETLYDTSNEADSKPLIDLVADLLEQTEKDASNLNNEKSPKRLLSQHEASTENDASDFETEEFNPLNISKIREERVEVIQVDDAEEDLIQTLEIQEIKPNVLKDNSLKSNEESTLEVKTRITINDESEESDTDESDFSQVSEISTMSFSEKKQFEENMKDDLINFENKKSIDLEEELIENKQTDSIFELENSKLENLINFSEETKSSETGPTVVYADEEIKSENELENNIKEFISDTIDLIEVEEELLNKFNDESRESLNVENRFQTLEVETEYKAIYDDDDFENEENLEEETKVPDEKTQEESQNDQKNETNFENEIIEYIEDKIESDNLEASDDQFIEDKEIENKLDDSYSNSEQSETTEVISEIEIKYKKSQDDLNLKDSTSEESDEDEYDYQNKSQNNLIKTVEKEEYEDEDFDDSEVPQVLSKIEIKYKKSHENISQIEQEVPEEITAQDFPKNPADNNEVISEIQIKYLKSQEVNELLELIKDQIEKSSVTQSEDKPEIQQVEEVLNDEVFNEPEIKDKLDTTLDTTNELIEQADQIQIQEDIDYESDENKKNPDVVSNVEVKYKKSQENLNESIEECEEVDVISEVSVKYRKSQVEFGSSDSDSDCDDLNEINDQKIETEKSDQVKNVSNEPRNSYLDEILSEDCLVGRQNKETEEIIVIDQEKFVEEENEEHFVIDESIESHVEYKLIDLNGNEIISQDKFEDYPQEGVIRKAESELDISKLQLNLNESDDESESSDKLKEVISDIEKEIEEKSPISSPKDQTDENSILTRNENVTIFTKNDNNEVTETRIEETNIKYFIRPNSLGINKFDQTCTDYLLNQHGTEGFVDEEEEDQNNLIVEENEKSKMVESATWPLIPSNTSYNLNENRPELSVTITSDRIKEIDQKCTLATKTFVNSSTYTDIEKSQDKSYQVNPNDLPGNNMVDSQTQITPPISPVKKPQSQTNINKISVSTETDEPESFYNLILNEEQLLRKKLAEKENSLKLTSIATQTLEEQEEEKKVVIEHLEAKEIEPVKTSWQKLEEELKKDEEIKIEIENKKENDLKLNIRQKIKIQNLESYLDLDKSTLLNTTADKSIEDDATNEFYKLPSSLNQIKATRLNQTNSKHKENTHEKATGGEVELVLNTSRTSDKQIEANLMPPQNTSRSRSISNSSNLIDLLSLNLDRSKTWVEMTEAKLNYMIGETDAVLRSMHLDSSDDESKKKPSNYRNLTVDVLNEENTRSQQSLTHFHHHHYHHYNTSPNQLALNISYSSQSPRLISPEHPGASCMSSTNKTIEEMTQLYLENYKRQLEDSRKELNTKMSLLEKEKEKVAKIRDVRKRELYMRRQAAIEAFKLEREREIRNSQLTNNPAELKNEYYSNNEENEFKNDSWNDFADEDLDLNRTLLSNSSSTARGRNRNKRFNDLLPSQNREKLAKLRRNVVLSSTGNYSYYEDYAPSTARSYVESPTNSEYKTGQTYEQINSSRNRDLNLESGSSARQTSSTSRNLTSTLYSANSNSSSNSTSETHNNNYLTSPISIPVRKLSASNQIEDQLGSRKPYRSSETSTNFEWTKQPDSRLLIPVQTHLNPPLDINRGQTTSSSSNSSSIIDESRLLLKEYEQLRNDSVSEIQRAHDSLHASRMRTLQENKSSPPSMYSSLYSSSSKPVSSSSSTTKTSGIGSRESGRSSSRTESSSSGLKYAKMRELSPVSKFREEQKGYLLSVNTAAASTNASSSYSNPYRKEVPISIYSPLSTSSFLSSPNGYGTGIGRQSQTTTTSNTTINKTRIDKISTKPNPTSIIITDYSTKTPSKYDTYQSQQQPRTSKLSAKISTKYFVKEYSDSDEDKIC